MVALLVHAPPPALAAAEAPELAALRIVHLSPDAPLVDVLVDGVLRVRDLGFVQRSELLVVGAGRHEVRVFPHRPPQPRLTVAPDGADPGAAAARRRATPLEPVVAVFDLPNGSVTTVVLTGAYTPQMEEERRGHLSLQVSPADTDVVLEGPHGFVATLQGDQFLVGLEPGPYRASAQREGYAPAVYEVEVTPDATALVSITLQRDEDGEAGDDGDAAADGAEVVVGHRAAAWRGLELQPYRDDHIPLAPPGHALVRFVHAAPTVPALDLTVRPLPSDDEAPAVPDEEATELLASDLGYPNAGAFTPLPAQPLQLELRVAGTRTVVLLVDDLELAPGVTYTVFVSADPLTNSVWLVPVVDAAVPQWRPAGPER